MSSDQFAGELYSDTKPDTENLPTEDMTLELQALHKKLNEARDETCRLTELLVEARQFRARAENERIERFRELARMAELVMDKDRELIRTRDLNAWLERFVSHLLDRPWWWSLLPARIRRTQERKMLRRAGIFDTKGYLALHPDVGASRVDPLRHYLGHGMREGRARDASAARGG